MNLDQHPKRGILKDIDKTALLSMRDSGMTNQEIADSIGCCYATICKILGKQPPGMRKPRTSKEVKRIQMDTPRKRMKVSHVTFCGKHANFNIDFTKNMCRIEKENRSFVLWLRELEDTIDDLKEVLEEVQKYAEAG